jgi:hypothetical protein
MDLSTGWVAGLIFTYQGSGLGASQASLRLTGNDTPDLSYWQCSGFCKNISATPSEKQGFPLQYQGLAWPGREAGW